MRFIVEVAPAGDTERASRLVLPEGVEVVEDVAMADGSRVLVAAGELGGGARHSTSGS